MDLSRYAPLLFIASIACASVACTPHAHRASSLNLAGQAQTPRIVNGKISLSTDLGVSSTVGIISTDDIQLDANNQLVGLGRQRVVCTGVLIAPDTVLTAAHCEQPQLKYQFIFFTRDLRTWNQVQLRQVWQVAQEPTWVRAQMGALVRSQGVDLAVMRFHGAVPAGYEPVPIYEGQKPTPGMQVTVMGYGVTILNGTEIGTLRATSLRVIAQPVESRTINVEGVPLTDILTSDLRDDQFTLPSTQSGVCQGDSGGPAYGFFNGQLMLVGITASSYGTEAVTSKFAQCKTYSIHTYAFPHEHWIAQTVAQMRLNPKFGALDPNAK